ncbi:hypothetical protein EDB80DRAFT_722994 [Ilyonectria destructans]|nr:hypothetical protein EDB80DRAFT_722994 [Ilyonectria destructans]
MSAIYNLEPQPTASAILHTTQGELSPLDGYYDNTIFNRLVPGFILQGGDPTATGNGGESIYDGGASIARGLLGMANESRPNTNGSQFFFTLDKTEELNGKNTMFGRIAGDTIYNLAKNWRVGGHEEADESRCAGASKVSAGKDKKKKRKGGKQLLSFGDEEGDEDQGDAQPKDKPANKRRKRRPRPRSVTPEREEDRDEQGAVRKSQPEKKPGPARRYEEDQRRDCGPESVHEADDSHRAASEEKKKTALESMIPETSMKALEAGKGPHRKKTPRPPRARMTRLPFAIYISSPIARVALRGTNKAMKRATTRAGCHTLLASRRITRQGSQNRKKAEEELVVIDPREKARTLKEEKRAERDARQGKSGRAWDQPETKQRMLRWLELHRLLEEAQNRASSSC